MLIKTFCRKFKVRFWSELQANAGLVASYILQSVHFIDVLSLIIFESHRGIGRQFKKTAYVSIHVKIFVKPIG